MTMNDDAVKSLCDGALLAGIQYALKRGNRRRTRESTANPVAGERIEGGAAKTAYPPTAGAVPDQAFAMPGWYRGMWWSAFLGPRNLQVGASGKEVGASGKDDV
jgi:hypothetical protein